jgi:hypothetical protein
MPYNFLHTLSLLLKEVERMVNTFIRALAQTVRMFSFRPILILGFLLKIMLLRWPHKKKNKLIRAGLANTALIILQHYYNVLIKSYMVLTFCAHFMHADFLT